MCKDIFGQERWYWERRSERGKGRGWSPSGEEGIGLGQGDGCKICSFSLSLSGVIC